MEAVEGIPVYRDGELMVRSVAEPTIANRELEQLFNKEDPSHTPSSYILTSMEYHYSEHKQCCVLEEPSERTIYSSTWLPIISFTEALRAEISQRQ